MWRQASHQRSAPCHNAGFAGSLAPYASAGSRRNSPCGLKQRRDNSRRSRPALGGAEGEGAGGLASPLPVVAAVSLLRDVCLAGRVFFDSSPRRTPGSRVFALTVFRSVWCRLAVIGWDSPRRASDFFVATRKSPKKRPLPHRRLRRFPRFGRVRRVASKLALRAQTATRQFPPVAACARRCRRGGGWWLGFAFAGGCCGIAVTRRLFGWARVL